MNVLVPPDGSKAEDILAAIPVAKRHKWFHSMRSSQALTQSVFAAIRAFGRLDLLQGLAAECRRPAFFHDRRDWVMGFECRVGGLSEPRPTEVDVLLSRPGGRVAVECKLLEDEFGTCSRTDGKRYPDPSKHCNGSYRIQNGRRHRCALTEIGVRYWEHLPSLFNWPSDGDHDPCPFGATYQLARNALAANLTMEGGLSPVPGHVLVMYDSRNPAFQAGGKADRQWEQVNGACLTQGLFRRLSWQGLLVRLSEAPELDYLVEGLGEKYGLEPGSTRKL